MNRAVLFASILSLASGCGSDHAASANDTENAGAAHGRSGASAGPDPRPSGLRIRTEPARAGEIAISIEEHADERVRLARTLVVEQRVGERWNRVEASELSLRADCSTPAPACLELTRGGALRPPPWSARSGKGQCTRATEGSALPAGTYRVVATSCDGVHRVESESFSVPR